MVENDVHPIQIMIIVPVRITTFWWSPSFLDTSKLQIPLWPLRGSTWEKQPWHEGPKIPRWKVPGSKHIQLKPIKYVTWFNYILWVGEFVGFQMHFTARFDHLPVPGNMGVRTNFTLKGGWNERISVTQNVLFVVEAWWPVITLWAEQGICAPCNFISPNLWNDFRIPKTLGF